VAVSDVASVDSGPAFKSAHFVGPGEGMRLLRGDNIEPGSIRWDRTKTWPQHLLAGYEHLAVQEGDLILGMDRPIISTGLKLARIRNVDVPALLVQRVARIRVTDIDSRYLYHWLNSGNFSRHLTASATGTQLPHVTLASIREFQVPRFGADTERRIVAILEDHFSRLDAAEAQIRNVLTRMETLRSLLLADLHGRGNAISLGELAIEASYGTSTKCDVGASGPPVVRIPNLIGGRIDLTDEKRATDVDIDLSRYMLSDGDILIVRTNGSVDLIGRSAVVQPGVKAAFASYLIRYRVDKRRVRPQWVHAMLSSPKVRARLESLAASSAGQHNLSLGKLNSIGVPVPSLGEQDRGLQRLTELDSQFARLNRSVVSTLAGASKLRASVLDAAFSGYLLRTRRTTRVLESV
jgi:type I restriction enzyme S subunit